LRYGASGYLLKDFEAPALLQGIRTVAAGEALLAPAIARRIAETWTPPAAPATPHPSLTELTDREREILVQSPKGAATPSWPPTSTSALPPRRPTSAGSWPSSVRGTGFSW
jgi:DNA-binding NarL/FixJ family response regulator